MPAKRKPRTALLQRQIMLEGVRLWCTVYADVVNNTGESGQAYNHAQWALAQFKREFNELMGNSSCKPN